MGRPGVLPSCRLTASSSSSEVTPAHCWSRAPPSKSLSPRPGEGGGLGAIGRPLAAGPSPPCSSQRRPRPGGLRAWGAAGLPCLDAGIQRALQGMQLGAQVLQWKWGGYGEGERKGKLNPSLPRARLGWGRGLDPSLTRPACLSFPLLPASLQLCLDLRGEGREGEGVSSHHSSSAAV